MKNHVIESVQFAFQPGTSADAFQQALAASSSFLLKQKGFVARRLSVTEDGHYLDHVEWTTRADAEAAASAFMKEPALLPFMQMIDPTNMIMGHHVLLVAIDAE